LAVTLTSVLSQRDVELEVVVVDDGSHDGTAEMVRALADPRVRVLRHERSGGVSAARNAGCRLLDTPWIAFCDDDDLWAPAKLAAQLDAVRDGARWCATGGVVVDADLRVVGHRRLAAADRLVERLQQGNVIPVTSGVMVEAALLIDVGGFDPFLRVAEDWELWVRLARHSPLAVVDRPLVAYRVWPASMTLDTRALVEARRRVVARGGRNPDRTARRAANADFARYLAKLELRRAERVRAARLFTAAAVLARRPGQLARAGMALAAPRVTDRVGDRRAAGAVPLAWRAGADVWLEPLRSARPPTTETVNVDLLRLHPLTAAQAARHVAQTAGRDGGIVVTPNVDHLRRLRADEQLRRVYDRAGLVLADGAPLVWAARVQGDALPARVAGADLLWYVAAAAAANGRSMYLLGGRAGSADETARVLAAAYPGVVIAGTSCPPHGFEQDRETLAALEADVVAAAPDIVVSALGSPRQELLNARLHDRLPGAWFLGLGAALDMAAGAVRRAPPWVGELGLEWVVRLAQEPGRLARRYLVHDIPEAGRLLGRAALTRLAA